MATKKHPMAGGFLLVVSVKVDAVSLHCIAVACVFGFLCSFFFSSFFVFFSLFIAIVFAFFSPFLFQSF